MNSTSNKILKNIALYSYKTETPIYYYKIVVDDVIQTSLIITLFAKRQSSAQVTIFR